MEQEKALPPHCHYIAPPKDLGAMGAEDVAQRNELGATCLCCGSSAKQLAAPWLCMPCFLKVSPKTELLVSLDRLHQEARQRLERDRREIAKEVANQ